MKQLLTYFGLAYFISWTIWLPLYGPVFGLNGLAILPFHHALGGLGPLIASFITTGIFHKKEGVKQLAKQCFRMRPLAYLAIALFSPFAIAITGVLINAIVSKAPINLSGLLHVTEFPQFSLLSFFIYNLFFFGFGEEVGWRGFALPRLQYKFSALNATILLTIIWALWHLPLFLYRPGYTTMGVTGIVGWIFSLLTGSVLLTWLYNSTKGSILVCAVFHSTIDIAFTADIAGENVVNYMGFLITIWGILMLIIFKPKNLAQVHRKQNHC